MFGILNKKSYLCDMKIIPRPRYINRILKFLDKGMIIALTGQRRVGKSFLLRMLIDRIYEINPEANVIFINKEKKQFAELVSDVELSAYLSDKILPEKSNYLLIDEVQDIRGFENVLRSLNADDECQIIITGSNAKMMSSELSTYLGGRYIDIHVQSLTFMEFLEFHQLDCTHASLSLYLSFGGLPHLYRLGFDPEDIAWEYLQNIYNTIVLRDVVEREQIRNVTLFENLMSYVSDNTGQLVSATSLSKYLKSQRVNLTPLTAINYLKAAENAFIINKINRYDIHGKRLLDINDKFYFEDLGLRNVLVGRDRSRDIEKIMENAVYLHLKSLGYKTYIGVIPNGEVDFIAECQGRTVYIQVTYLLASDTTVQREFGNLQTISDNYPKYVVSLDPINRIQDYDGINHINLLEFLCLDEL